MTIHQLHKKKKVSRPSINVIFEHKLALTLSCWLLFLSQNSFIFLLLLIFSRHHHPDREDQDEAYAAMLAYIFRE